MRCSPAWASEPPIDDDRRVDQADAGREDLADVAAGLAHRLDRASMLPPLTSSTTSWLDSGDMPGVAQFAGECGAGGERLEAAAVAALAGHFGAARHVHVADVAGRALRAALQDAAGDDAGPDARRDLHEDEVVDLGPGELALAERHDVDVVVDEHGRLEGVAEPARHVEPVPAGHDRRVDRASGSCARRVRGVRCRSRARSPGARPSCSEQFVCGGGAPSSAPPRAPRPRRMRSLLSA